MSFWRTQTGDEVDFVVYTESEFTAIEVKNTAKPSGLAKTIEYFRGKYGQSV